MVIDAAGLGSAPHRVRLFWTNWCRPEILQEAIPTDIKPNPPLEEILHDYHVPTIPSRLSNKPFAKHNKVGLKRVCMPKFVSYPLVMPIENRRMENRGKENYGTR